MPLRTESYTLSQTAEICPDRILNPTLAARSQWDRNSPALVVLAAGKGTRFGKEPKCVQPIDDIPLARHSINAFRSLSPAPSICVVGYRANAVAKSLGDDNIHILSQDSAGGTALAAYEAFTVEEVETANPVLVVTMGDRIVPAAIFEQLLDAHGQNQEADLTILTAIYKLPNHHGKGRIVRDEDGSILRILEQRDIDLLPPGIERDQLQATREGNCPLYAIRARTLKHYLGQVRNNNAQQQFYFTDIVAAIAVDDGTVRAITVNPQDPPYELLCADVTSRNDLGRIEDAYRRYHARIDPLHGQQSSDAEHAHSVQEVAALIAAARPAGQIESIANQLQELVAQPTIGDHCPLGEAEPVGIGICGGRLRIAFMHPDMGRFFGPAWQMPIGAADQSGREQIVVLMQRANDEEIRFSPANPAFREQCNSIDAGTECMFPGTDVVDLHRYELFGTSMAEQILAKLGYVTEQQISSMRSKGEPLPPASQWVINNMRRPFSLLANAIASIRTIRSGVVGQRVQASLAKENFTGLKVVSTGDIPRGGFSSSSAVTLAVQNAMNSLYDLQLEADQIVDLACQAEYGTGVRAGALDQATEQTGSAAQGALISSNPRENYRLIRTFPVPTDRFRVLFPYTVDRDREAWRWSMGRYAQSSDQPRLTTSETRKMTGKASEIAAILLRLPLDQDFFQEIEDDLIESGELTTSTSLHVRDRLKSIPLRITQDELRRRLGCEESWYAQQLAEYHGLAEADARELARTTIESLLSGWRDPLISRSIAGHVSDEIGAPLRAMVGYLYGEVSKNCYLVHHPQQWIACVSTSQLGDRCYDIDAAALPDKKALLGEQTWEKSASGSELMERWLQRVEADLFDFNADLDDQSLSSESSSSVRHVRGTNFFRGLPLIDLAEAMLKRAFGAEAVAVRVNGAGQGDYFQVHVDTELADPEEVKQFIRIAFYRRFSLSPEKDFVEPHPGGGAVGVKLARYDQLPALINELRRTATAHQHAGKSIEHPIAYS